MSVENRNRQNNWHRYSWEGKPYYSLGCHLKQLYGSKVYKLSIDGGFTCPNRDNTLGAGGCIFCSEKGSGDFAESGEDIILQIERAKQRVAAKMSKKMSSDKYIAYFQSFTNTYGPIVKLQRLFTQAIKHPDIVELAIATRPDCLPGGVLDLLERLNMIKPVTVELGLQSIHERTAAYIRRGYELTCFDEAVRELNKRGLTVVVHVMLGLPGETKAMMLNTIAHINDLPIDGIKLQLLHVLKDTDLAEEYEKNQFSVLTKEEYLDILISCVENLRPDIVIHRLTGDGPKSLLIAPLWSADKKRVLNSIMAEFKNRGTWQGKCWKDKNIGGWIDGDE